MAELLLGISLGWAAGISPGPLSTLVLLTALQRGFAAGARVAVAPLLTDAPIILLSLLVVSRLSGAAIVGLSVVGGAYLVWLGIWELRKAPAAGRQSDGQSGVAMDLRRGFLTNLLSPHPWLFWATVGAPILVTAWDRSPVAAAGFLAGFFGVLVGTKLILAGVVARTRHRLNEGWYRRLVVAGGVLLIVLGALLVIEALA